MPQKPYAAARDGMNAPVRAPELKNACQQPDEVGLGSRPWNVVKDQGPWSLAEPCEGPPRRPLHQRGLNVQG